VLDVSHHLVVVLAILFILIRQQPPRVSPSMLAVLKDTRRRRCVNNRFGAADYAVVHQPLIREVRPPNRALHA